MDVNFYMYCDSKNTEPTASIYDMADNSTTSDLYNYVRDAMNATFKFTLQYDNVLNLDDDNTKIADMEIIHPINIFIHTVCTDPLCMRNFVIQPYNGKTFNDIYHHEKHPCVTGLCIHQFVDNQVNINVPMSDIDLNTDEKLLAKLKNWNVLHYFVLLKVLTKIPLYIQYKLVDYAISLSKATYVYKYITDIDLQISLCERFNKPYNTIISAEEKQILTIRNNPKAFRQMLPLPENIQLRMFHRYNNSENTLPFLKYACDSVKHSAMSMHHSMANYCGKLSEVSRFIHVKYGRSPYVKPGMTYYEFVIAVLYNPRIVINIGLYMEPYDLLYQIAAYNGIKIEVIDIMPEEFIISLIMYNENIILQMKNPSINVQLLAIMLNYQLIKQLKSPAPEVTALALQIENARK